MFFASLGSVHIVKNCDQGLEYMYMLPLNWPPASASIFKPESRFFPIWTDYEPQITYQLIINHQSFWHFSLLIFLEEIKSQYCCILVCNFFIAKCNWSIRCY